MLREKRFAPTGRMAGALGALTLTGVMLAVGPAATHAQILETISRDSYTVAGGKVAINRFYASVYSIDVVLQYSVGLTQAPEAPVEIRIEDISDQGQTLHGTVLYCSLELWHDCGTVLTSVGGMEGYVVHEATSDDVDYNGIQFRIDWPGP